PFMSTTTIRFQVPTMDCPSCVGTIQRHLSSLEGVLGVEGNPIARTLSVAVDAQRTSPEQVRAAVNQLGYAAHAEGDTALVPPATGIWATRQARIAFGSVA